LLIACSLPESPERKEKCDRKIAAGLLTIIDGIGGPETVHTADMPCDIPYPINAADTIDWYRSAISKWLREHPDIQARSLNDGLILAYGAVFHCKMDSK